VGRGVDNLCIRVFNVFRAHVLLWGSL
jgi:hypothetical protein